MRAVVLDVMAAVRSLTRARRFFLICVVALAVGIGVSTALFSILNAVVLRPLPFSDQQRIVVGWKTDRIGTTNLVELSYPEFVDWRQRTTTFERMAALPTTVYGYSLTLTGRREPAEVETAPVSWEFFDVFGMKPRLGRTLEETDDRVGANPVAVVTDDFWRTFLAAEPTVVGTQIELSGRLVTVVGVLPPGLLFPRGVSLFTPLGSNERAATNRAVVFLQIVGKLRPSVDIARARDELNGIIVATAETAKNRERLARLTPIADYLIGRTSTVAAFLFAGAVSLLIVSAANLAGLLASRSLKRETEIATRMAVGAGRGRLRVQFLTESLVIAAAGAGAGLFVAVATLRTLLALAPDDMLRVDTARIDGSSWLFAGACVVVVALVTSVAPLLTSRETSIVEALRAASAGGVGRMKLLRLNGGIVGAEIAITVALLIVTVSVVQTSYKLSNVDTGFDRSNVLTAGITLNRVRYPDPASRRNFFKRLTDRLESDRSVTAVGAILLRPLEGAVGFDMHYVVPGQSPEATESNPIVNYEAITPNYFKAIGTRLITGRIFGEADDPTRPLVAVVSETLAKRMYNSPQDALGRSFQTGRLGATSQPYTIVGVVADARYRDLSTVSYDLFVPYTQSAQPIRYLVVRSAAEVGETTHLLRSSIAEIDPQQASSREKTLQELIDGRLAQSYFYSRVLTVFGIGAALLSAIGIYALISEIVTRRARELALRVALGGTWRSVANVIFRSIAVPVGVGLCTGVLATFVGMALLRGEFEDVPSVGVQAVAMSFVLMFAVVMCACASQIRRSSHPDVISALKA